MTTARNLPHAGTSGRFAETPANFVIVGRTARPVEDSPWRARTKNVHRVGRVSGGLLNPSGGALDRPRNKSVLAQRKNELNHNFASRNEFRLTILKKTA
jgi:hypothetical protein